MTLSLFIYQWCEDWLKSLRFSTELTSLLYTVFVLLVTVIASYLAFRFAKWLTRKFARFFYEKSKTRLVEILDGNRFFSYLCFQFPLYIVKSNLAIILPRDSGLIVSMERLYEMGVVILFLILLNSVLNSFVELYQYQERNRSKPITGLIQFVQIVIAFFGVIVCISILFNISRTTIMTGLGAASAVLMLVFKDSITGLVAGVQLSFNRMIEIGDWISLPKYDVDGEVVDITITSVKVRNWDKSVSSVPSYSLVVSDSVKNWKTMLREGSRKMERSINLDVLLVRQCTPEILERCKQLPGVDEVLVRLENTNNLTNLTLFRTYLEAYLKNNKKVNGKYDVVVRPLQATQYGLPLEISCFLKATSSKAFEEIQSEIFEHIYSVVSLFDLNLFQVKSDEKVIGR